MNELLEIIDDLKMLDALDNVSRDTHIARLLKKYGDRFEDQEKQMELQAELFTNNIVKNQTF